MPAVSEERARARAGAWAPVSDLQPSTLEEAAELGMAVAVLVSGESSGEWIAFTPAHTRDDDSEGGSGKPLVVME